jgi:EAL domain-containing protein (putative c-di-GMP-specific phosphodiesterase class I)/GGDEF domain-containing protein
MKKKAAQITAILFLTILIGFAVYFMGGTSYPVTHLMYIPIIIAGFLYNIKGAMGTALFGGLILGPLMPYNVAEGIMQGPSSWLFRLSILSLIGLVIGYLFQSIRFLHKQEINQAYIYEMTGYPNSRKLKYDIRERISRQKEFSLMTFKIMNIEQINNYIDYSIGEQSLQIAMKALERFVDKTCIYSIFIDEFAVAMWGTGIEDTYVRAREYLDSLKEPIIIDGVPISLDIKCGISNYPLHGENTTDLFKDMGRALDQSAFGDQQIAIYEEPIALEYKARFETISALYEAIKKDQFTMVYQPIENLKTHEIESVEALLRWENSKGLNPDQFIKIAEDAGIMSEISKWVIKHVIDQLKEWLLEGVKVKVAINISSKDLKNDGMINYAKDYIKTNHIEPTLLEFELTERIMIESTQDTTDILNQIKDFGIKISLDDFGTGYNSLVQFVKLPIDYVKIDKNFIDSMEDEHYSALIKGLIDMAHSLGQKVIAEGVETEAQLRQLDQMGCDHIQGYFLSRPLTPKQLKGYIQNSLIKSV